MIGQFKVPVEESVIGQYATGTTTRPALFPSRCRCFPPVHSWAVSVVFIYRVRNSAPTVIGGSWVRIQSGPSILPIFALEPDFFLINIEFCDNPYMDHQNNYGTYMAICSIIVLMVLGSIPAWAPHGHFDPFLHPKLFSCQYRILRKSLCP